ncbi:MAG TPA: hypothetical protein VKC56_00050 [Gallionellaceae bacterium]|nr:hypothetical protein [Gallionellaceae bacterium]
MASDVDICNLALAQLGDSAAVQSINPPDQSAQAAHCARFYPIARDALLAMHTWGFATARVQLAQVSNPFPQWQYAYAPPSDALDYLAVLDPAAADDYSVGLQMAGTLPYPVQTGVGIYTPQPFQIESIDGDEVILTNQANALLRYTRAVSDTAEFSPLFVQGLATLLASHLAGPVLKGAEGRAAAMAKMQEFIKWREWAIGSDANQRNVKPLQGAAWMVNR